MRYGNWSRSTVTDILVARSSNRRLFADNTVGAKHRDSQEREKAPVS